jgi:hypothetical protein
MKAEEINKALENTKIKAEQQEHNKINVHSERSESLGRREAFRESVREKINSAANWGKNKINHAIQQEKNRSSAYHEAYNKERLKLAAAAGREAAKSGGGLGLSLNVPKSGKVAPSDNYHSIGLNLKEKKKNNEGWF